MPYTPVQAFQTLFLPSSSKRSKERAMKGKVFELSGAYMATKEASAGCCCSNMVSSCRSGIFD